MIRHPKAYRLTYHNWHHSQNEKYWIPTFIFFRIPNFGIGIPISWFFNSGIWLKFFRPESSESGTNPEFRFQWGSQKLEPKIGIPNQALLLAWWFQHDVTSIAKWRGQLSSWPLATLRSLIAKSLLPIWRSCIANYLLAICHSFFC